MLKSCSKPTKLKYIKSANNNLSKTQLLHLSLLEQFHLNFFFLNIQQKDICVNSGELPIQIQPWICINFCPKSRSSSFSFSYLQQSTHHHPSCYLHQFLLIKLQTSFIIIFISFCMGLAENFKKKTQNQYFDLIYNTSKSKVPLSIEKKSTRNIRNKTLICFKKLNILFLIACYRSLLKNLGSIFHSMWLK